MSAFVGVDAGGSHCEAAATTEASDKPVRALGGAANLASGKIESASKTIAEVVRAALQKLEANPPARVLVVGAAGASAAGLDRELSDHLSRFGLARNVQVVTDAEIAFESVYADHPGILLMAGTGSIAYARDQQGNIARVGGHGFLFGDEGSGYAIAATAVRAVFRAADGRGQPTQLSSRLATHTHSDTDEQFVAWCRGATRADVARLAPLVIEVAQGGDAEAERIIDAAIGNLIDHVTVLRQKIQTGQQFEIALHGGLFRHNLTFRDLFLSRLGEQHPDYVLSQTATDPALGALRRAESLFRSE